VADGRQRTSGSDRPLARLSAPLAPATLLELQFLTEAGRIRFQGRGLASLVADERWTVDEAPAADWFTRAAEESWTRDPFDRLIVAHARLRRCRLATGDTTILGHLPAAERLAL
jgi:PIN domain nuclease of toxin-antitoxin system